MVLLTIRGFFATYLVTLMIISIIEANSVEWLTFATSWNYAINTLYFLYAFVISLYGHINSSKTNDVERAGEKEQSDFKLPVKFQLFWILFNISITLCLVVVIIYWPLLHDPDIPRNGLQSYLTIDRHGINFLFLVIDFFLHKIPVRFLHFVYPSLLAVVYLIFNVLYWVSTNNIIYPIFDWNKNPGMASGYAVGVLLLVMLAHFFWYWVNKGKKTLVSSVQK